MTTPYQRSVLDQDLPSNLAGRFWLKVARTADVECWEWTAFRTSLGYGMIRVVGKMELAHRVSWVLHHGPLDPSAQVLHQCDNPPCVNPRHLFVGDNSMNVADKVAKGRSSFPQPWRQGERHHNAKLTQADVDHIRAWSRERGQGRRLARQYGVSPATITNVIKRKVWRNESDGDPGPSVGSPPSRQAAHRVRTSSD